MSRNDIDRRWLNGMDGWRVRLYDGMYLGGIWYRGWDTQGEVTGYSHSGCFIWVVFDGESEPHQLRWDEVRPA